jgi:hypothetical protein
MKGKWGREMEAVVAVGVEVEHEEEGPQRKRRR